MSAKDRGPKRQTILNSPQAAPRAVPLHELEPTSILSVDALREFYRLLTVLDRMGILERVDLAIVTEASRVKELLDKAYELHDAGIDVENVKIVVPLISRHQGLMRMLGLSVQPSRTHVHTVAKDGKSDSSAKLVKYPA